MGFPHIMSHVCQARERTSPSAEVLGYIREVSQGEDDLLPGLVRFTEGWLEKVHIVTACGGIPLQAPAPCDMQSCLTNHPELLFVSEHCGFPPSDDSQHAADDPCHYADGISALPGVGELFCKSGALLPGAALRLRTHTFNHQLHHMLTMLRCILASRNAELCCRAHVKLHAYACWSSRVT